MDAVPEVLGRSALVSLSATAIALAFGVPLGTWLALGVAGAAARWPPPSTPAWRCRRSWSGSSSRCCSGAAGRSETST